MQVLVNDESLKNESPGSLIDRGPAHAYQLPVRVASRNSANNNDIEAEGRLPMRLRGVKAAYGRALGTAGKLCLDKHAATVGGNPESAAQAWEHLTKAAEVVKRYRIWSPPGLQRKGSPVAQGCLSQVVVGVQDLLLYYRKG